MVSLIEISMKLNQEEESYYKEIIRKNNQFKEAKMLQSVEEWGMEKGMEKGLKKGREENMEKTAVNLLKMGVLTKEQIAEATGLPLERIEILEKTLRK